MSISHEDTHGASVTFVVTTGQGSMDLYSQRLARHLAAPLLTSEVYRDSARHFGLPLVGRRPARAALADQRFVRQLRRLDGPVHLPNHHLARYGPLTGRPYVVTVHDLIRWTDRERESPLIGRPNVRDRLMLAADCRGIRRAAGVIAVSATTAGELVERLGLPDDRVAVAYNGVDSETFHPRQRPLFDFPYVLFVGSEQPRKNFGSLLAAISQLAERPGFDRLRLVKVGEPGNDPAYRQATLARMRQLGLGDRVLLTGWLSDAQLAAAYAGATCLVVPSLYEGFGLPPVEAMACGCPVIASGGGSLGEVLGGAALRLASCDPDSIAGSIRRLVEEPRLRVALTEQGLRRASEFTWERAAAATRAAYARFADALRPRHAASAVFTGSRLSSVRQHGARTGEARTPAISARFASSRTRSAPLSSG